MEERKLTGYPSIDKPWLKYYSEDQQSWNIPECSCFELIYKNNREHLDEIALSYYGNNITYKELFHQIDKTAEAFLRLGVREGEIVSIVSVDIPETIYAFYALNKIGACSNMLDPRYSAEAIRQYLLEVSSRFLLSLDLCLPVIKNAIVGTTIEKVIVLSSNDSLPFLLRTVQTIRNGKQKPETNEEFILWHRFIHSEKNASLQVDQITPGKDRPVTIVHTGGTTGTPKGVLLSNYNLNAVVHEAKNTPLPLARNSVFLNVTVPFVAFGLGLGMHIPLCLGWKSVLIPDFRPPMMPKLMKKYKPQLVVGTETYFAPMLDCEEYDFSHTKAMLMGGMPTKEVFEEKLNERIRKNGGSFAVSKGYSMTEASAMGTCSYTGINEVGSNGIPLACTVIAAFDPETGEEKRYNETGEICLNTPTTMLGYYKNEEATRAILRKHTDGKTWIHSGDLGYITEDGFVYIVDRIKRMIMMSGFKIFPAEVENVLIKHPDVVECAVVGMYDPVDDKVPCVFVKTNQEKSDSEKLLLEFQTLIEKAGLPSYYNPRKVFFVDQLPITAVGKIDFRRLERIADSI